MKFEDLARSLRCGNLADSRAVFEDQPGMNTRNRYLLSLHVDAQELERFASHRASLGVELMAFASPAEVMYAVIAIDVGGLQWRHVVPLWNEQARVWFEDILAQRSVTLAANLLGTSKVALIEVASRWSQGEAIFNLAREWPELAERDKLMDFSVILARLLRPASLSDSIDPPEVRVVTHCPWLHAHLSTSSYSEEQLAEDARTYAQLVH